MDKKKTNKATIREPIKTTGTVDVGGILSKIGKATEILSHVPSKKKAIKKSISKNKNTGSNTAG